MSRAESRVFQRGESVDSIVLLDGSPTPVRTTAYLKNSG